MFSTEQLLNRARNELLDLSTRNRLLSIPVGSNSARIIQVQGESSGQVFRLLVAEKKRFRFLPGRQAKTRDGKDDDIDLVELGFPAPEEEADDAATAKRHADCRLQTSLSREGLQRRLFELHHDARTMIEEQGVNILYLVLGHLKWFEADHADTPRFSPLIMVPVELSRRTAAERFVLEWTGEEIQENLSLRAKLKLEFDIEMPSFPDDEDLDPSSYFKAMERAISGAKNWAVIPDAVTLGFFSFAKFLMYRDLDPKNWPRADLLLKQQFITGLLQDGFPQSDALLPDDSAIDEIVPASRLDHVVDADGSQTLALEAVRQGRSLVIQGPPGTGKSQSICNIISTAVLDGKRVLFIAEKLAALEVVKRRLEREGLGALCLELHSNKSNKRAVIEEIGRTWKLGRPKATELESLVPKLEEQRTVLNNHVAILHTPHDPSGLTPFSVIGHLSALETRGAEAAELQFPGAENWPIEKRRAHRKLVGEIAVRIDDIGLPVRHPWRGVCRETVLSIDLEPLLRRIRAAMTSLLDLRKTAAELAAALSQPTPTSFKLIEEQQIIADYVAHAPPVDKAALCNGVWNAGLDGLRDVIAEGRKFCHAVDLTRGKVTENVWEKDLSQARVHIAAHGTSLFRFLNGNYRAAISTVRGVIIVELPRENRRRLELLDAVISGQGALRKLRDMDAVSKEAFGSLWRKEKTDWNQLETVINWVVRHNEAGLGWSFRRMFAGVNDQPHIAGLLEQLKSRLSATKGEVDALFLELAIDPLIAFGCPEAGDIPVDALNERLSVWLKHPEDLVRWSNYYCRAKVARECGLASLIELLERGEVAKNAADCFDRIYFTQLLRVIVHKNPDIGRFDGSLHDKHVSEFKQLDSERLALAKYKTLVAHFNGMPPLNVGVGPAGIVKSEMERKRGHRTVRRLLKDAGSVVQTIKPVFMMSPLSVAQFLEPGAVEFDLLVIDEASQVQPVDAFGAIGRCKQIVVVGDSKQLPPTRFFSRITSNEDSDAEETAEQSQVAQAQEIESILGLCRARGLPEKMLRWHYRSRHHSLIAVSNHEFYEDKLFIVPSPYSATSELGLKFNHVPNGVFDSGASGTNRVEAKAICRAIIMHARENPKQSLGVAAFSVRQREAIHNELELLRRENPDTESFFSDHSTEPFFVKNLENVQGDERDVIFVSVGYGKDVHGFMAMRFGPLSSDGGERRLNVLISRAKKRCEVFASITADDIDLNRASGRGVAAFKTFLMFAQTGRLSVAAVSGRSEESPFEEAVRRAVETLGYEVHPQVGIAGFFIDLAVLDKANPARYLIGIECDGAAYHSSRSARDRDRLRQAVLEDHGWIIHRIWSTDWFQRPTEQLRKVAEAIERAKLALREIEELDTASSVDHNSIQTDDDIERETILEMDHDGLQAATVPYDEVQFEVPRHTEPHQLPTAALADIVIRIVEGEGPIHEDEIVNRVRTLWAFARAGARIHDAVAKAIRSLLVSKRCLREEGFLTVPNAPLQVRNRELVSSSDLRKPEMLPPAELRLAILSVIDIGHGATKHEIPTAVARMLGFKTTGAQLRSTIEQQLRKLLRQGAISESNGMFKRV